MKHGRVQMLWDVLQDLAACAWVDITGLFQKRQETAKPPIRIQSTAKPTEPIENVDAWLKYIYSQRLEAVGK
ncbi:MAG TPA: hypothetical protein VGZ90_13595 [Puia sp.]|jgi:hypothetical protein|nr:hypothetical protein [Puia sp.]